MAINFPTSLDTLVNPTATDQVATVSHADQHANANDAIEALEAKVGADGSAVTTSHDYKLSGVTASDKAASLTGSETLTNKTLTTPKFADTGSINDTNSNELVKFSVTASAVNEVNVTNNTTGNAPIVGVSGGDTNIDIAIKGKGTGSVKIGTAGLKFPNTDGIAGQIMKTDGSGNISFITQTTSAPTTVSLARLNGVTYATYSDSTAYVKLNGATLGVEAGSTIGYEERATTSDWASASVLTSAVILGGFVYVMIRDASNNYRVYRYTQTNLAAGGTLMTIATQAFSTTGGTDVGMFCDGTNFYFNYQAGNSANDYILSKYTLSGTTLTHSSNITCGSTANSLRRVVVDLSGNIYAGSTADNKIRKFNSAGTLQTTSTTGYNGNLLMNYSNNYYMLINITGSIYNMEKITLV